MGLSCMQCCTSSSLWRPHVHRFRKLRCIHRNNNSAVHSTGPARPTHATDLLGRLQCEVAVARHTSGLFIVFKIWEIVLISFAHRAKSSLQAMVQHARTQPRGLLDSCRRRHTFSGRDSVPPEPRHHDRSAAQHLRFLLCMAEREPNCMFSATMETVAFSFGRKPYHPDAASVAESESVQRPLCIGMAC